MCTCLWNKEQISQKVTQPTSRLLSGPAPLNRGGVCARQGDRSIVSPRHGELKEMVAQPSRHKQRSLSLCVPSFLALHLQDALDPGSILTVSIFSGSDSSQRESGRNSRLVNGSPSSVGSLVMHISLWNNCNSEGPMPSRVGPGPSSAAGVILRVLRAVLVFSTHSQEHL